MVFHSPKNRVNDYLHVLPKICADQFVNPAKGILRREESFGVKNPSA